MTVFLGSIHSFCKSSVIEGHLKAGSHGASINQFDQFSPVLVDVIYNRDVA